MRVQIEVDRLPVKNGPGATRWLEVAVTLLDELLFPNVTAANTPHTKVKFTVELDGKVSTITIKITAISRLASMNSRYYHFEGLTPQGRKVQGWYTLENNTGELVNVG